MDKLTVFAHDNNVLITLVAHPTKMPRTTKGVEIPDMYDVSGSSNFANMADFGITVHREPEDRYVIVRIWKVKFRQLGDRGDAYFTFNKENGRYINIMDEESYSYAEPDNSNFIDAKEKQQEMEFGGVVDKDTGEVVETEPDNSFSFSDTNDPETPEFNSFFDEGESLSAF